ncbi:MAG: hypothetical protein CO189_03095 [candidate division Zixibacteria bacterium CG_4_9_14_3_um_filter_46_8]|nr:MAG: hypothetical protein CO189_03095 [candidate division Zixibacteria bacterium CG_4_9_14_3_um_filter_46_8]
MNKKPTSIRKSKRSGNPRLWVITSIATGLLAVIIVIFLISFFEQVKVESSPPIVQSVARVQVLNGCGARDVGEKTGEFIRSINDSTVSFDVIEIKNAPIFGFDRTLVVSRDNDDRAAKVIAARMKVNSPVLTERLARNPLEIDITVVIGSDFEELEI